MPRSLRFALLLALAAVAVLSAGPARASAAACPSFQVLHDDRVGALQLPAGPYDVSTTKLTCAQSTSLFAEFLDDYDGKLRAPWKTTVLGVGRGRFTKGTTGVSFSVTKTSTPHGGGGGGSHGALACPSPYRVTRNERIQSLSVPKGLYRITRLGTSISCGQSATLLASFLKDFFGPLPGGWTLLPGSAAFVKGSLSNGFRIKPWSGPVPPPVPVPTHDTRCPSTFRVLHNDHIGALRLPSGPYYVYLPKGSRLSCSGASGDFRRFLQSVSGRLPYPWVLDAGTATFRKRFTGQSFRVKPV